MLQALDLAEKGIGRTCPNPPVGSVIVTDGEIVGRGFHPKAGEPHAEVFALRDAGEKARGATVYVTLEPCSHTGKTGPCADALIKAGVAEVVIGCLDPNPRVAGRGVARLEKAGVAVRTGVLEEKCRELITPFTKHILTGRPFTLFKAAMTLDGQMATASGDSRWVSCEASRAEVHQLRDQYDAIMVGSGTVIADDPMLTARLPEDGGLDPLRIVVDSDLETPLEARLLGPELASGTVIVSGQGVSEEKAQAVQNTGARLWILPREGGQVSLGALWDKLGEEPVMSVLLEGGPTLARGILKAGLIDRMRIYIAPKIVGGQGPVPLFLGDTVETMAEALPLKQVRVRQCDSDIVIEGDVTGCLPD